MYIVCIKDLVNDLELRVSRGNYLEKIRQHPWVNPKMQSIAFNLDSRPMRWQLEPAVLLRRLIPGVPYPFQLAAVVRNKTSTRRHTECAISAHHSTALK